MRQMKMVNLYFSRQEVHEALRLWCEKNHPMLAKHFSRSSSMDWIHDRPHDPEFCVSFDGEVEDVLLVPSDETRIFTKL